MCPARTAPLICAILLGLIITDARIGSPVAQESWNPFKRDGEPVPPRRPRENASTASPAAPAQPRMATPDPGGAQAPPWQAPRGGVERGELEPIMAPDASGLPLELWRGLDLKALEGLLAGLDLPPRSPTLHQLWRRMLLANAAPPSGAPDPEHFVALRLEALYRSGLLGDMDAVLKEGAAGGGAIIRMLGARRDIGLGNRDAGCQVITALASPRSGLPGRLKGETQLLSGYCAAAAGDTAGAGLSVSLAREEGVEAELALAVLAGVADGSPPRLSLPTRVLLLDYRFLELLGPVNAEQIFDKAEPALLVVLAGDAQADPRVQLAATEAALRLNALTPDAAAEVFRRLASGASNATQDAAAEPLLRRAQFLRAAELAQAPAQRARFLRALLDDARKSQMQAQMARVVAPLLAGVAPTPDLAGFADTAVEIALADGDFARARLWAEAGGLRHQLALIEIADPNRRGGRLSSLAPLEEAAARGRIGAEALQRLATVLDALDIDVPIALWEAANRTPQSSSGFLPETGVLADLAQASQRGEVGRTILLVMRTLGPRGPEGANVLALGDAVRALKRAGLEADARRLALEALAPAWPRLAQN